MTIKKTVGLLILFCLIAIALYIYITGRPLTLDRNTSLTFALPEDIKETLYYASMAPSGHNTQPWIVRYDKKTDTYTLAFDIRRGLTQVDPHHRESFISLGAFLENWRQAAQAYGYVVSINLLPKPDLDRNVARITLTPTGSRPAEAEQQLNRMLKRHTDKRNYEDRPIPKDVIHAIPERNKPYLHFYAKGTQEYAWLAHNTIKAMNTQAHHKGKRIELANWLRFSNTEARENKDGLPAEQLGLTGPIKTLFYTLYSRETTTTESFAVQAVNKTEQQVANAAGFFVITGATNVMGSIQAGIHFEHFWLDAVKLGISLHPMSQIIEEAPFANNINKVLGLTTPIQMIVRAGINKDYGKNHQIRRDIGSFVEQ